MNIVLTTPRIRLAPPSPAHAEALFAYGQNADFAAALKSKPQASLVDAERFVEHLMEENAAGRRMYWIAELNNRAVGTVGFIFRNLPPASEAELGYGFSPETWGTGIAQESAEACLEYGFRDLALNRIRIFTRESNTHSCKFAVKLRFVEDDLIRAFYDDGESCRVYSLTRQSVVKPAQHSV